MGEKTVKNTLWPYDALFDTEFDLDISVVESGPVIDDLMRVTDDGCGTTCESACPVESGC